MAQTKQPKSVSWQASDEIFNNEKESSRGETSNGVGEHAWLFSVQFLWTARP